MEYIILALWGICTGVILMGSVKKQNAAPVNEMSPQQIVTVTDPVSQPPVVAEEVPQTIVKEEVKEAAAVEETPLLIVPPVIAEPEPVVAEEEPAKESKEVSLEQLLLNADGTPLTYTVQRGEFLTLIANKFYGNSRFWPYIIEVNRHLFTSPEGLQADMKINLPSKKYYNIDANNPESVEKARALIGKYLK